MQKEKAKILVVDEDHVLRLVEAMLAPEGYEVVLAHSGEEGLEKMSETSPDLILLDIRMPGLNGFEVLRIVRERYDIPVIMLTAVREVTSVPDWHNPFPTAFPQYLHRSLLHINILQLGPDKFGTSKAGINKGHKDGYVAGANSRKWIKATEDLPNFILGKRLN